MKKNAVFLNFAAQSPIIELHLSVADKIQKENGRKTKFYVCDSALSSCSININNSKLVCILCKSRAINAIKLAKENKIDLETKFINKKDLTNMSKPKNKIVLNDIELGVRSSIASHIRTDQLNMMNKRWKIFYRRMFDSSLGLFNFFLKEFKNDNIENISLFNGRFSCSRPVVEAAKVIKNNYYLFDTIVQKRPVVVKNNMLHNLKVAKDSAIKSYLLNFKSSQEIADKYIYSKRNKIQINDKVYTTGQTSGTLTFNRNAKKIISIFTSSDDEYRYIGADWKEYPIVDQVDSIKEIMKSKLSDTYQIVVRMHPNQNFMPKKMKMRYDNLQIEFDNLILLKPSDSSDSYALIDNSEIVINFCSSIGVEANYIRKPVVQIGPSSFRLLPVSNYVNNVDELIKKIITNDFKLMPKRASTIWFCYLTKHENKLEKFNVVENGEWQYSGKTVETPKFLRFFSLFSKIYVRILKGDFTFLKDSGFYLKNLIFNKYKVK